MATYATVQDIVQRYEGTIDTSRHTWVATLLDDAESLLRDEVPALDARVGDGRTTAETVRRVLCSMVLDVLRNPSGYSSQTAGEFSYSFQGGGTTSGGRLRLLAQDKAALLGRARAHSVPLHDATLRRPLRTAPLRDPIQPRARREDWA